MGARPIGSHGHYPAKHFPVPAAVAAAARDGLALRKRWGRGGTEVGIARARQLASGSPRVTLRDIVYIRSYLRRHVVDNLGEKNPPSNGWIAWQLWGGWPAKKWVERIYASAKRKGWIVRRNPAPRAGADAAFFQDVDAALRGFAQDSRAKALLRENRFAAWDNGGCLALQQALLLFFEDELESNPDLDAVADVQPGYVISSGVTEHALVWVEREGAEPLAIDSTGVKPGVASARDWQQRTHGDDRDLMTVLFDEMPADWFAAWRARIADDDLVAATLIIFTENFMKVQSKQQAPRSNPFTERGMPADGGREPYLLVRCVNGVIESKLNARSGRVASPADVSSAHAICTAQLQKSGLMDGSKLTAKGRRKNERIWTEEQGPVADRRLAEYEHHLAEGRAARAALSKGRGRGARKNPDAPKNPPTELMRAAAPLIAGSDPERIDEAALIEAGEPLSSPLYNGFWEPLVEARNNLTRTIAFVDREITVDLSAPLLMLEAIRQRALAVAWAKQSLTETIAYLAEIDALLAYWVLVRLLADTPSILRGNNQLDDIIAWSVGAIRTDDFMDASVAFGLDNELIGPAMYQAAISVVRYNEVSEKIVKQVERELELARVDRRALPKMAADVVVSMPPHLINGFAKTRRQRSRFRAARR